MEKIKEYSIKNTTNERVALFIDCENVSAKYIDDIIGELATYGEVNIRKAYGNWESKALKTWKEVRFKYGLESVLQPPIASGKNSTDIKMTIDIMNIVHSNSHIQHVAIATSDSDFTPLINEIKLNGIQVIGFGEAKTHEMLRVTCSQFFELKNITKTVDDLSSNKLLISLLKDAIYHCGDDDGFAHVSKVGLFLKNRNAQQAKNFGRYKSWGEIFKKISTIFEISYPDDKSSMMVRLK